METTIDTKRLAEMLAVTTTATLREIIAIQRAAGHAFGVVAEAARLELGKRGARE
jgi:hypothetical protein